MEWYPPANSFLCVFCAARTIQATVTPFCTTTITTICSSITAATVSQVFSTPAKNHINKTKKIEKHNVVILFLKKQCLENKIKETPKIVEKVSSLFSEEVKKLNISCYTIPLYTFF